MSARPSAGGCASRTHPARRYLWWPLALSAAGAAVTSVYVDGEQRSAGAGFPQVLTTPTGTSTLGVTWWDSPFAGAVDELQVHRGALTAAEVAALAAR